MLLSTSIFWARLMRGTWSSASALTLRAARALSRSAFWAGKTRQISSDASCRRSTSLRPSTSLGPRTLSTTSAPQAASPVGSISAPAATNASSEKRAPRPAPASTTTEKPRLINFLTLSGDAATRISPGQLSFGTPSLIDPPGEPGRRRRAVEPRVVAPVGRRIRLIAPHVMAAAPALPDDPQGEGANQLRSPAASAAPGAPSSHRPPQCRPCDRARSGAGP